MLPFLDNVVYKDIQKLSLMKGSTFMPKEKANKRYTPEFKIMVAEAQHIELLIDITGIPRSLTTSAIVSALVTVSISS